MLSCVRTVTNLGYDTHTVTVECDASNSLPAINVVGLAHKTVDEAKERIRSALRNSKLELPPKKYTLNLAPADVPKEGSGLDLPMAVAILSRTRQIQLDKHMNYYLFGELSLNGEIRPINGLLNRLLHIRKTDPDAVVIIPERNAQEAQLLNDLYIRTARSLQELYRDLIGEHSLPALSSIKPKSSLDESSPYPDMNDIVGNEQAKRALEVAAAGGHHILMNGPPGGGKTMLAQALAGILPPPRHEETLEITALHSLTGAHRHRALTHRPFRSPHHSSSMAALIGGGNTPRPGEISLAHRGILFLDELPEYSRQAIEALRQPLEDKQVTIARARSQSTFPADFMLVATQNPCPCGFATEPQKTCTCSANEINRYVKKISGPLLDRIDITLEIRRINSKKFLQHKSPNSAKASSSPNIIQRVMQARYQQRQRNPNGCLNAELQRNSLENIAKLDELTQTLLEEASEKLALSARAILKTVKVARTIADIEKTPRIATQHIAEALQYRQRDQYEKGILEQ